MAIVFIVYGLVGPWLFGWLYHRGLSVEIIIDQSYFTTEGILGVPMTVAGTYVILFIIFGSFLEQSGAGQLFMVKVKGDSMIDAGILDGDYVVVRQQATAEPGDTVVAGIPDDEGTVKTYLRRRGKVVLRPENPTMDEMVFDPADVAIYGKVVTLLRRL